MDIAETFMREFAGRTIDYTRPDWQVGYETGMVMARKDAAAFLRSVIADLDEVMG